MPRFSGQTPEALLGRNDSKNPATTCKGITSSGRPCRRGLAAKKAGAGGIVAVEEDGDGQVKDARFYCWQHQDQAGQALGNVEEVDEERERFNLKERGSIDTLVQKLGLDRTGSLDPRKNAREGGRRQQSAQGKPPRRTDTRDFADGAYDGRQQTPNAEKYGFVTPERRRTDRKKPGFWASLCCMAGDGDDDYVEVVRHRKRTEGPQRPTTAPSRRTSYPSQPGQPATISIPARKPVVLPQPSPSENNSPTSALLSLIPPTCSPQTASALLTELSRPPNPNDEQGYIYIFWLTPDAKPSPPESTARSLLSPSDVRPRGGRRISDVMAEYSFSGKEEEEGNTSKNKKKTIMLKIGRASNVTRRMNEWQRQCGCALTLVRWYPYVPSSSSATPSPLPSPRRDQSQQVEYPDLSPYGAAGGRRESGALVRKVPLVKRVERLIHLELTEQRVNRSCEVCGREHREWFEVDASEVGVRKVDEVVKRWVEWAERQ